MTEINFLNQRRVTLTKVDESDAVFQKYSLWAFSIAMFLFFISAGVNMFFVRNLKEVNGSEQSLTRKIDGEESTELTFLIFSHKLKTVKGLYQNRSNKQQAIDYFSNLFGSQVFLSGMNYGGEGNSLSLKLTSENVFALERILSTLESEGVKEAFSTVTKSGLKRDDTGAYDINISVELLKEGELSANTE